ncbi:hypothetical protein RFI_04493, partial [Reticulomyxa filosa]
FFFLLCVYFYFLARCNFFFLKKDSDENKHAEEMENGNDVDDNNEHRQTQTNLSTSSTPTSINKSPFHPNNFVKTTFAPGTNNLSTAATVDELDTLPDMQELHNYDKHKELGTGTDAHVYEVIDKRDKSHVAMKLTKRKSGSKKKKGYDSVIFCRYRTEINLLYALRTCPYVVKLLRVLENQSVYVLILEQAPMTLENLLHDRCCELPMQEKVGKYIIFDVLKGVKTIHNLGFVHKDIKPENVLIFADHSKRKLQAKIADFGFATRVKPSNDMLATVSNKAQPSIDFDKVDSDDCDVNPSGIALFSFCRNKGNERDMCNKYIDSTLSHLLEQLPKWTLKEFTERVSDKCGTPGFWAPELVSNTVELKHAFKMDVFSVGVTLYRMLCNEMPFGLFETWEVKECADGSKKLSKMKPNFQIVSWLKTKPQDASNEDGEASANDNDTKKPKFNYIRKIAPHKLSADCADLLRGIEKSQKCKGVENVIVFVFFSFLFSILLILMTLSVLSFYFFILSLFFSASIFSFICV